MVDLPVEQSGGAPEQNEDPTIAAQRIVADPALKGSPEWLAATQLLSESKDRPEQTADFDALEKEMQGLKGMSEI